MFILLFGELGFIFHLLFEPPGQYVWTWTLDSGDDATVDNAIICNDINDQQVRNQSRSSVDCIIIVIDSTLAAIQRKIFNTSYTTTFPFHVAIWEEIGRKKCVTGGDNEGEVRQIA